MFFFFKQKTAYEMRISDWSSDVCSSDLCRLARYGRAWLPCHARFRPGRYGCCSGRSVRRDRVPEGAARIDAGSDRRPAEGEEEQRADVQGLAAVRRQGSRMGLQGPRPPAIRSEERRVGKEGVSPCRTRW